MFDSESPSRLSAIGGGEWEAMVTDKWYTLMQARLLYCAPSTRYRRSRLKHLFSRCHADTRATANASDDPAAAFNARILTCVLCALDGNPSPALRLIMAARETWAAAHLADLLWHHGVRADCRVVRCAGVVCGARREGG